MYEDLFREFSARCCAKIASGEEFASWEFDGFTMLLAARELTGHRWLGEMASNDPSLDTVSGRCGLAPAAIPTWREPTTMSPST